jgi:hypothetical protein
MTVGSEVGVKTRKPRTAKRCNWLQDGDESSDTWRTECGRHFRLDDGNPIDSSFRFCPYCGRRITATPLVWDGEGVVFGATGYPRN